MEIKNPKTREWTPEKKEGGEKGGKERREKNGRAPTAVIVSAEQRGECEQFNGDQGRKMQVASQPVDQRQRPEQTYADYHCPARKARMRIAEVKEQTDRLRQRGAEEVREDEISR